MAKNVEQIKQAKEAIEAFMNSNQNAGWDDEMSRIPLSKGNVVTLTGDVAMQKSTTAGVPDWLAFETVEGYPIGLRQLFRRGNGLKFPEGVKTPREAANVLIDKCAQMENGLPLTLKEVKKLESSTREGKNTYYVFEAFEF